MNIKNDLSEQIFLKIKPLTLAWICTRCPLNIPSTTHPAPLSPPYLSSSLHSLSSACSSIPKYQMSKRLLWGWPSQGSPWAGWANGTPCVCTHVCIYRYTGHTISSETFGFWGERAWKTHVTNISFPSTARKNHLQSYKMTPSHFGLFNKCPKFTSEINLSLITIWETTGVGKKETKPLLLPKSSSCT